MLAEINPVVLLSFAECGSVLPTSLSLLVEFFASCTFSHPHRTNFPVQKPMNAIGCSEHL